MHARIISATVIWAVIFGANVALSGAPFRVHAVDAAALLVAFWIPALFLDRVGRRVVKTHPFVIPRS